MKFFFSLVSVYTNPIFSLDSHLGSGLPDHTHFLLTRSVLKSHTRRNVSAWKSTHILLVQDFVSWFISPFTALPLKVKRQKYLNSPLLLGICIQTVICKARVVTIRHTQVHTTYMLPSLSVPVIFIPCCYENKVFQSKTPLNCIASSLILITNANWSFA